MGIREIDKDLPAYLEFLILKDVRKLRKLVPDHYIVKAIEKCCAEELAAAASNPHQRELEL